MSDNGEHGKMLTSALAPMARERAVGSDPDRPFRLAVDTIGRSTTFTTGSLRARRPYKGTTRKAGEVSNENSGNEKYRRPVDELLLQTQILGFLHAEWHIMDLSELLSKFDGGELIGLVAVTGAFLVGAWGIYLSQAHKTRRVEALIALKLDMLKRGMSAQDIQVVLDSGSAGVRRGLRRCLL